MKPAKEKLDMRKFMSKNVVAIVMIPAIFGAHYMWYRMQSMEELVRPDERERLQLEQIPVTIYKKVSSIFSRD